MYIKTSRKQFLDRVSQIAPPGTDLGEFKAYLLSQLLWNASSRELGQIASEFLGGYYGPSGAVAVKNYMDTMTGSMKTEGYASSCERNELNSTKSVNFY